MRVARQFRRVATHATKFITPATTRRSFASATTAATTDAAHAAEIGDNGRHDGRDHELVDGEQQHAEIEDESVNPVTASKYFCPAIGLLARVVVRFVQSIGPKCAKCQDHTYKFMFGFNLVPATQVCPFVDPLSRRGGPAGRRPVLSSRTTIG